MSVFIILELDSMISSLIPTWNQSRIKVCMEDVTRAPIMEGIKKCYVGFILGIVLLGWGPTVKEHADTTHVFVVAIFHSMKNSNKHVIKNHKHGNMGFNKKIFFSPQDVGVSLRWHKINF